MCLGRDSNPHGRFGPRDFRTTMAFATITVCGLDYSFTMGLCPLGVPCLVSAPSSFQGLGSRLPSALPVKVSLNLRHSTSLFSESALKLCLSPSCLPFHHQGIMWDCKGTTFFWIVCLVFNCLLYRVLSFSLDTKCDQEKKLSNWKPESYAISSE